MLHATVFAGMEGENGHSAASSQTLRKPPKEHIESAILIIDGDPQRLKNASHGDLHIVRRDGRAARQLSTDDGRKSRSAGDWESADDGASDSLRVWFIGVFAEQGGQPRDLARRQ
jgi:hypothetical protein